MNYHPPSLTRIQEFICYVSARIPGTYLFMVRHELGYGKSILDVGCGNGMPMYIIAQGRHLTLAGIDIFPPSVHEARATGAYKQVRQGDVRVLPYKKKSFDQVVSIFVLEHLKKRDAAKLLTRMEYLAKEKVVVVVPMGACEQHAYENNVHQEHLSQWYAKDFQNRGYTVTGQGLNIYDQYPLLHKLLVAIGPLNHFIFLFHVLFQPFISSRYTLARHLICVKQM